MLLHVQNHAVDVVIYAIHVLVCVLEFAPYHVNQVVQHQLIHVDIGVIQHVIRNVLVIVIHTVSIIVADHVYLI